MTVDQWTEQTELELDRLVADGRVLDRAWCLEWIRQNVVIVPDDPRHLSPTIAACNAFHAYRRSAGRLYADRY